MLIGIGSVKGSPGATMLGLGLAAVWPGTMTLFVEADPSGGDVAVWYGVGEDPGLVSLAAATRRATTGGGVDIWDHAHDLGAGLCVIPGPLGADQAWAAVKLLAPRSELLRSASENEVDVVIVDVGRLDPKTPAEPLLDELDVLLVMSRTGVSDLAHLASRGPALTERRDGPDMVGLLLTGECHYRTDDIEEAVGLSLMATVPFDAASAAALMGEPWASRWGRRGSRLGSRPLMAALRDLAERLDAVAAPRVSPPPSAGIGKAPSWAIAGPLEDDDSPAARDRTGRSALSAADAGWTRPPRTTVRENPWVPR